MSRGLAVLDQVQLLPVAAWVKIQRKAASKATVTQRPAAVRMMFDWLVVGQFVRSNPASSVHCPKPYVERGRRRCSMPIALDNIERIGIQLFGGGHPRDRP